MVRGGRVVRGEKDNGVHKGKLDQPREGEARQTEVEVGRMET